MTGRDKLIGKYLLYYVGKDRLNFIDLCDSAVEAHSSAQNDWGREPKYGSLKIETDVNNIFVPRNYQFCYVAVKCV